MENQSEFVAKLSKIKSWNPVSSVLVTLFGYGASQIFAVILLLVAATVMGWQASDAADNISKSVWLTFGYSLAIYASYLYIIKKFLSFSNKGFKDLGLHNAQPKSEVIAYALAGFATYFVLAIVVSVLAKHFVPAIDLNQKQDLGIDTSTNGLQLIPVFLTLVVMPPIAEEIVCRGFLYTGLRKKLSMVVAGFITSVIFALAHLQWGNNAPLLWSAALDTFVLSCVLVYVREKTGSLYPAIGIHMIKNGLAFLALFVFRIA